jgi:hypothetical protein
MNRLMFFGAAWILVITSSGAAEDKKSAPYRVTITSAAKNKKSENFRLTAADVPGTKKAPWSIRQTLLHGGKQEGVELLTIDNGKLTITVIPTRGMSVLEVREGDLRLGWNSPVKEVVHPHYINSERRGGLGWLEGFNEWMVRCGLEYAGHPGLDGAASFMSVPFTVRNWSWRRSSLPSRAQIRFALSIKSPTMGRNLRSSRSSTTPTTGRQFCKTAPTWWRR